MEVFFATNRDINGTKIRNGINESPALIRFGRVMIDDDGKATETEVFAERKREITDGDMVRIDWAPRGSSTAFRRMLELARDPYTGDILIYLHGAAHSLDTAAEAAAQCARAYGMDNGALLPFIFSYPTNGLADPMNYLFDRDDAQASGPAMARAYGRLIDFVVALRMSDDALCGKRIHLLAHSLGAFALRQAIQGIIQLPTYRRIRLFDTVILAHADEDADCLASPVKLGPLAKFARRIVAYYDRTDKLLRLSDNLFAERLGQVGPRGAGPSVLDDCEIMAVDCEHVDFDRVHDQQRHRHYLQSTRVIEDIRAVLSDDRTALANLRTETGQGRFRL